MLLSLPLTLVFQVVQASAGLQTFADGAAEVQLAGMGPVFPLGGELTVDFPGNILDDVDGLGDLGVLELADIPVQQAQLRVRALYIGAGVLHEHLLFQHGPGEDGLDEIAVKTRIVPPQVLVEFLHAVPELLPLFLTHGGVELLLLFG